MTLRRKKSQVQCIVEAMALEEQDWKPLDERCFERAVTVTYCPGHVRRTISVCGDP